MRDADGMLKYVGPSERVYTYSWQFYCLRIASGIDQLAGGQTIAPTG